jgi:hypothetical protein
MKDILRKNRFLVYFHIEDIEQWQEQEQVFRIPHCPIKAKHVEYVPL